jgi:hypothetical protein
MSTKKWLSLLLIIASVVGNIVNSVEFVVHSSVPDDANYMAFMEHRVEEFANISITSPPQGNAT